MKKSPLRLAQYLIGCSCAFIALSNCFNALSNSSGFVSAPPADAPEGIQNARPEVGLDLSAGASAFGSPNEGSSRGAAKPSLTDLVSRSATVSFLEPQATTTVTASKTHMLPVGDTQADPGDNLTYSVVITNTGVNAALNVNFTDTIDPNTTAVGANGSLIVSPIAVNDSFNTIGNVNIVIPVGQGVIANDLNPNGPTSQLEVTQVNATAVPSGGSATVTTAGGSVTMSSDGSFTYNPDAGFRGPNYTFTYTLGNGTGKTDTATTTIAINSMIWFVNSGAGTNGDGRLTSPFNCLTGTGCFDPAASDAANDIIFLYSSGSGYVGGLTLLAGQIMIGQGASQSILTIPNPDLPAPSGTNQLPATGGANPTVTTSAGGTNAVNLGTNNQIWGITFGNTTGADIDGSSFGTLLVRDTTLNGNGQALNLTTSGTLDAIFQSIASTNSAAQGINISGVGGSLTSPTTSITNPGGIGISVGTSSATFNFGSTTSTQSGGTGVSLTTNTGTITFGTLNITPDSGQRGLLGTDNTTTITTAAGAITTTGAIAVEITRSSSTTPLGMMLTSVSASGGAANGIKLTNTSGFFTIGGDNGASNNGSGGTISATTAEGIVISNGSNISLGYMNITNSGTDGIHATTVNGFTLNRSNVTDNAGITQQDGVEFDNASGTVNITNSTISGSPHENIDFDNNNTNLSAFNVTGSTIQNTLAGTGANGILFVARGTSVITAATITGNTISGNQSTGIQPAAQDTANIQSFIIGQPGAGNGNTFTGNNAGIDANQSQGANITFRVVNNTFNTQRSQAINAFAATGSTGGTMTGFIQSNVIGTPGTLDSGSAIGSGIRVVSKGGCIGSFTIDSNQVREVPNGRGIEVSALRTASGNGGAKVKVTNNSVTRPTDSNQAVCGPTDPCPLASIFVSADNETNNGNETVCSLITGNTAYDPTSWANGGEAAYYLQENNFTGPATHNTEGTNADPKTQILNTNTVTNPGPSPGTTNVIIDGGVAVVGVGTCGTFATSPQKEPTAKLAEPISDQPTDSEEVGTTITSGTVTVVETERTGEVEAARLTEAELNWMVQAAIARWEQAGITAEDVGKMRGVRFEIGDLGGNQLASGTPSEVRIDETAGGYGWFYDHTPREDSEFDVPVPEKERQSTELRPGHGKVDLLTVLVRELGHAYLEGKDRIPENLRALMETTLAPAVRRMPVFNIPGRTSTGVSPAGRETGKARIARGGGKQPNSDTAAPTDSQNEYKAAVYKASGELARRARRVGMVRPFSGETVTKLIGTIPVGESVTIMFQVTIDNPFPAGVCTVTNPAPGSGANVTGTNFNPVTIAADVTTVFKALTLSPCPANITQGTDPNQCTAVVTYTEPTADGCPVPTVTCAPASGTAFATGTTTVTCTASNAPGTADDVTCTFTVTVDDTQAPTITCPANIITDTDPGVCTAVETFAPTTTDNCPLPPNAVVCTPASGTAFPKGTTTVNCTVTDGAGLTANCSFTVTVNDTTPPTITCPANITVGNDPNQCSAVVNYPAPTVTDNCPSAGTPVCTPAAGTAFPIGTTTVNCTVSDGSGNPANCSFTVTVNDTTNPVLTCPANVTQGTDAGVCTAVVNYAAPTVVDNCAGSITPVCTPASGSSFPTGTTTVNCTASDPGGNSGSCSFTVTVNDTINPTITCPADVVQGTDPNQCVAIVNYATPTGSDNCPLPPNAVVCTPPSGGSFPKGTTTVNCTVTDGAGLTATCSFTVTVNDTQAPVITCPANVVQGTAANQCSAVVTYANATATDNCPNVGTPVCSPPSGSSFPTGTTTVNCTVTDGSGNPANCSFTVTVNDTQNPTITCPANITVTTATACQVVSYPAPTATDNCPLPPNAVVCNPPSGFCFPPGATTVNCTVTDGSGNMASCSFTVTVVPCVITCPANITRNNQENQCGAIVTFTPATSAGCGTVTCSPSSGSFFPKGTTTVTCTTQAGPSCSFTVKVNDTQPPTITQTTNVVELWPPNHTYRTVNVASLVTGVSDNCDPGTSLPDPLIKQVTSDEPDNIAGNADGNTTKDIVIAANCKSVQLRAERNQNLNGRVYTITLRLRDSSGNLRTVTRKVVVPKNQSGGGAIDSGTAVTKLSNCP